MRGIGIVFAAILFVAVASYLPTEMPEEPIHAAEKIDSILLSKGSGMLFLKSAEHDYEFRLPPNHLEQFFQHHGGLDSPFGCWLGAIAVDPANRIDVDISVSYGGYDSRQSGMKSILSDSNRRELGKLGFVPSNGNVIIDVKQGQELLMTWNARVKGHRYAANSRSESDGLQLVRSCRAEDAQVISLSENAIRRNHRYNTMCRPLFWVREKIDMAIVLIVSLLVGGVGPRG